MDEIVISIGTTREMEDAMLFTKSVTIDEAARKLLAQKEWKILAKLTPAIVDWKKLMIDALMSNDSERMSRIWFVAMRSPPKHIHELIPELCPEHGSLVLNIMSSQISSYSRTLEST